MKVAYEPHPVTPERKAELREQGFRIIDARFAPAGALPAEEAVEAPTKTEIATMKKAECIEWLARKGIPDADGTVLELRDMLRGALYPEAD